MSAPVDISAEAVEYRVILEAPDYGVSQDGRVCRLTPRKACVKANDALKPAINHCGYVRYYLVFPDGRRGWRFCHRLVADAWLPPKQNDKQVVAHLNGDKSDNRAANLAWVTYAENESHKRLHGTALLGARNPAAKLTEDQVINIRRQHFQGGATFTEIARSLGLSRPTVRHAVQGRLWGHVKEARNV